MVHWFCLKFSTCHFPSKINRKYRLWHNVSVLYPKPGLAENTGNVSVPSFNITQCSHLGLVLACSDKWVKSNQKFGAPHSCLVGKYKAFGEKISALAWKKTLNPSAQDLKIQWEIQFSSFLLLVKTLQKNFYNRNMDLFISKLLSKSILDFWKWSNWKYANTYLRVFTVWPLPEVQNWFWRQFWNEKVHISNVNFFCSVLTNNKKNWKLDFP